MNSTTIISFSFFSFCFVVERNDACHHVITITIIVIVIVIIRKQKEEKQKEEKSIANSSANRIVFSNGIRCRRWYNGVIVKMKMKMEIDDCGGRRSSWYFLTTVRTYWTKYFLRDQCDKHTRRRKVQQLLKIKKDKNA